MAEAALTATAGATLAASGETPTARAIRRFKRRRGALLALAVIAIFVSAAALAPLISPYNPDLQTWTAVRKAPSALHWFGTDDVGRDVLARVIQTTPVRSASLAPTPQPQPNDQVAARWLPPAPPDDAAMTASATTVIGKSTLPLSRIDPTISNQPRSVKTITIHTEPVQPASVAPTPVLVPDAAAAARPSTQFVARRLPSVPRTVVASPEPTPIVQSPAQAAPAFSEPAKLESKKIEAVKLAGARVELAKIETVNTSVNSQIAVSSPKAPHPHDGWLIQIGAFDREDEAKQHLSMARLKIRDALATAHPLTERVQQGGKVLYRARFTGFNKETAQAACRWLRRSDSGCIALKDLN